MRELGDGERGLAALGPAAAAEMYGLHDPARRNRRRARQPDSIRLARPGRHGPGRRERRRGCDRPRRDRVEDDGRILGTRRGPPGSLVEALLEFSRRDIDLARIESRPQRRRLGQYLFFIDIEGRDEDPGVAEALAGLRSKAGFVDVLGSYRSPASSRRPGDLRSAAGCRHSLSGADWVPASPSGTSPSGSSG